MHDIACRLVETDCSHATQCNGMQELASGLQVHRLPLAGLETALEDLATSGNYAIDSRLYAFALGLAFSQEPGPGPLMQPSDGKLQAFARTRGLGKGLPERRRGQSSGSKRTSADEPQDLGGEVNSAVAAYAQEQHEAGQVESSEGPALTDPGGTAVSAFAQFAHSLDWRHAALMATVGGAALAAGVWLGQGRAHATRQ
jgi:hypothetical protein